MTANTCASANRFSCCSSAAVFASAHIHPLLDTAMDLVVSICVLCLALLRIIGLNA